MKDGLAERLPLAALAEISADKGDLAWHTSVMAVLRTRGIAGRQSDELEALSVRAMWTSGRKGDAVQRAKQILVERPAHVLTRVILSRMLGESGESQAATEQSDLAAESLTPKSPTSDLLYVADLLYERHLHAEAAPLFERIVTTAGPNGLTQRYLTCLLESGQRHKARDVLDALPPDVRARPTFRRIESNLARQMGDWGRMRDVLRQELDRVPSDSGVAVGYIGALHRIPAEKETLKAYLGSDPVYDGQQPFNEVEVAKYQREHGFRRLALRRLYRLFRERPNDAALGGYFLAQMLIGEHVPEADAPATAVAGAVVHLRSGAEVRDIAIDFDESDSTNNWPELVPTNAAVARRLLGKCPGDTVSLPRGMGDVQYDIVGLSSVYAFAATKVHKLLAETANPGGPLWSVNLVKTDGELDIGKRSANHILAPTTVAC